MLVVQQVTIWTLLTLLSFLSLLRHDQARSGDWLGVLFCVVLPICTAGLDCIGAPWIEAPACGGTCARCCWGRLQGLQETPETAGVDA